MAVQIAMLGCGFWSRYQLAAWRELPSVEIVALYCQTTRVNGVIRGEDVG